MNELMRMSGEISEAIGLSKPAVVERLKKPENLGSSEELEGEHI